MSEHLLKIKNQLIKDPKSWLITGVAGFIGSSLLETLLKLDQTVIGLDNLTTGYEENLEDIRNIVTSEQWNRFTFNNGDICDETTCHTIIKGVDHVLHQAALGSVPRSIKDPIRTHKSNISGFLNLLVAAKEEGVSSFTYASSSSIYGDNKHLPKTEDNIGNPLSPYAVTKYANELYAHVFANSYNFNTIGLRYFNVFGKRQDPNGSYAAVIPKWISAMISHEGIEINGDGTTSRDFCFIDNVVQMNILSALSIKDVNNQVFNVAFSEATTLLELFSLIKKILRTNGIDYNLQPIHKDFRHGDVKHSLADISKGKSLLQYEPEYNLEQGLVKTISYYLNNK